MHISLSNPGIFWVDDLYKIPWLMRPKKCLKIAKNVKITKISQSFEKSWVDDSGNCPLKKNGVFVSEFFGKFLGLGKEAGFEQDFKPVADLVSITKNFGFYQF